jgi:TetR/AcrR family transcriptional regulator, transcriptional repressor for nem operon
MRNSNTREKLLQAGQDAMHQSGFVGTGVLEITNAAGVPKGSFYNHFPTKEGFGAEVADRYFSEHTASVLKVLSESKLRPIERLQKYFEDLTHIFTQLEFQCSCMLGNFALEMSERSPLVRDRLVVHFATWTKALAVCIRHGQEAGEIRSDLSADELAEFTLNSWEGALLRMRVDKNTRSMDIFRNVVFKSLIAGS